MMSIASQAGLTALYGLFLISPSVSGLEVSSGEFIQTVNPTALENSSTFIVNDFFDEQSMIGLVKNDLTESRVLTAEQLASNTFIYALHGSDFNADHPNRTAGINSFASQFTFDSTDILQSAATGRIGLGGVMRFDLPARDDGTPRFFIMGDWTLEYDNTRTEDYNFNNNPNSPVKPVAEHNVSGWFLRNHIDFPVIGYDVLNQTIFSNSDSFYLSGDLAWSPELVQAFFPESELYRPTSSFVMCAQDDVALAEQTAMQIPCVFPNITLNGQSDTAHLNASESINLTVDLGVATSTAYPNADYFVAFVYQDTFYWLNSNFEWSTSPAAAYQGRLVDFRNIAIPSPASIIGPLNSGMSIPIYFGVDTTQNSTFDEPYRFTSVTLQVN